MQKFWIYPSILSADFARLGEECVAVLEGGADAIHFDVMDNHYVPNLTIGPLVCRALRAYGVTAPIDVHLMVRPVDPLVATFAEAGASYISFHPEASDHPDRTVKLIKSHGCKAGLALNPATPLNYLDYLLDQLDFILLMSVNPGFGGQIFIPTTLMKLRQARQLIIQNGNLMPLVVDGGVMVDNISSLAEAGATGFVAGSAIFGQEDYCSAIQNMRSELDKSRDGNRSEVDGKGGGF